jgi:hypothetical protein
MSYTMRVSLSGYNALTDTDPDHYALYTDENWVLIKEKARGSGDLAYTGSATISHGLSYIPMVFVWGENSSGNLVFQGLPDRLSAQEEWLVEIDDSDVKITQLVGIGDTDYSYYIFYDKLE